MATTSITDNSMPFLNETLLFDNVLFETTSLVPNGCIAPIRQRYEQQKDAVTPSDPIFVQDQSSARGGKMTSISITSFCEYPSFFHFVLNRSYRQWY